ncbi:dynamin family protein [Agromyces indicus]|uniref:Dynamin family protein n=1 Tax=Agromyces indicus TaxID=758919 RepID=A0ABU1FMQ7_9MICO|nr:dynamin family protein [Agromyces indicus]MDR5693054.1 dynamin family protein [Agromyces indicus]
MSARLLDQADDLLELAAEHCAGDTVALARIREQRARLHEPLRVAIAGMVKAGKSTLLNAVIGEEIAPTDAGECTKVIVWYRHGAAPSITVHLRDGGTRSLPVRRVDGRLVIDLEPSTPDEVERVIVEWPSGRLEDVTLIDTPGIASLSSDISARSAAFLTPDATPSEADAVIYLTRHMHSADVGFLSAFHDPAVARSGTVNAIAVLSRADEIGAGRIDALLSARSIAERYRTDGSLRSLALDVVPIAGLLAQSARTLREQEFDALRRLARLGRTDRERILLSVDRFVREDAPIDVAVDDRRNLLQRFGMFGIRMAAVSIRSGHHDATALADELYRRSGMDDLIHLVGGQFRSRSDALKVRSALAALRALLEERPPAAASLIERSVERLESNAHELRELALLSAARTAGLGLGPAETAEAERLIGAGGTSVEDRLGLAPDAPREEVHRAATMSLQRWRALAGSPLLDRSAAEACDVVTRSCEALVVAAGPTSVERRRLHLARSPEPVPGTGEHPGDPPGQGQRESAEEQHLDEDPELGHRQEGAPDERHAGVHHE